MKEKLNILLIEDDAIEVMKFERTLSSLQMDHQVTVAENGEAAVELLSAARLVPDLILLDLNMPKMNGLEFLSFLKKHEQLHHIPAVILTTSNNRNDIVRCYRAGIAGYIIKPLKYDDYVSTVQKLLAYWSVNQLKAIRS